MSETYLDFEGRQLKSINNYNISASFKYNDKGYRTSKTVNGITTTYYVDGDRVLVEKKGSDTIYYTYDVDGSLISMNYNGNEYLYITNLQGDIIELVDINGNTVVTYKYDAWGNIIYQTDSAIARANPYRYRGYRYDEETGLTILLQL